jgi:hypothetical protein
MNKLAYGLAFFIMVVTTAACGGGGGGGGGSGSGGGDPGTPPGGGGPSGPPPGGGTPGGPYNVAGALGGASHGKLDAFLAAGFSDRQIGTVVWAERDHLYILPSGSSLKDVKAVADALPGGFTRFDGDDCYMPANLNSEPFLSRRVRKAEICFDVERGVALLETEIEADAEVTEETMNAVFGDITGKFGYSLGAIQIDRRFPATTSIDAYTGILKAAGFQERRTGDDIEYWKLGADGNTYLFEYEIERDGLDAEWVVYR